jgi:hypothetical protein
MVRLNSRAVTITINFQQYREPLSRGRSFLRNHSSGFDIVQYQCEVCPGLPQAERVIQLVRGDPDRVKNVADSEREEEIGLL